MRLLAALLWLVLASSSVAWVGGTGGGGGGGGDVTGPSESVDGDGTVFDGTSGKVLKIDARYRSSALGSMFRLTSGEFFKLLDAAADDDDDGILEYDYDSESWIFRHDITGEGGRFTIEDVDYGLDVQFREGLLSLNEGSDCGGAAEGRTSICLDDDGVLSVVHGLDDPVPLENEDVVVPSLWNEEHPFYSTGNTSSTTVVVATFDTSEANPDWPPTESQPGGLTQGRYALDGRILCSEYGSGNVGVYYLKARGLFYVGSGTPTIDSTSFTEKDDSDGAGGNDCYFQSRSGGVDLKCKGYAEYSGWLTVLVSGAGDE